jgi:hypothetical protein
VTNEVFRHIRRARGQAWPTHGRVSTGGHSIAGGDVLFPFRRSGLYDAYFPRPFADRGQKWAEATALRHRKWGSRGIPIVTFFLPCKSTCLQDLYPAYLPLGGTPTWRSLRALLGKDAKVEFGEHLLVDSDKDTRAERLPWRLVDSGLNERGAHSTAREAVEAFGGGHLWDLALDDARPWTREGDLSAVWGPRRMSEECDLAMRQPDRTSLPMEGITVTAATGQPQVSRAWKTPGAPLSARLVVVEATPQVAGAEECDVTFWLTHMFAETHVVRGVVEDWDLDPLAPDVVMYRADEEALIMEPASTRAEPERTVVT